MTSRLLLHLLLHQRRRPRPRASWTSRRRDRCSRQRRRAPLTTSTICYGRPWTSHSTTVILAYLRAAPLRRLDRRELGPSAARRAGALRSTSRPRPQEAGVLARRDHSWGLWGCRGPVWRVSGRRIRRSRTRHHSVASETIFCPQRALVNSYLSAFLRVARITGTGAYAHSVRRLVQLARYCIMSRGLAIVPFGPYGRARGFPARHSST